MVQEIVELLDTYSAEDILPHGVPTICIAVTSQASVRAIVNMIYEHIGVGTFSSSSNVFEVNGWKLIFVDVTNRQTFNVCGINIVALFITHEVIEEMCREFTDDILTNFKLPSKTDVICELLGYIRTRMHSRTGGVRKGEE
jgi:hypothetical protein